MRMISPCPNCNGYILYRSRKPVTAYSPDMLPGLGTLFSSAKFEIVVCGECGLIRRFASEEALDSLEDSKKWELMTEA